MRASFLTYTVIKKIVMIGLLLVLLAGGSATTSGDASKTTRPPDAPGVPAAALRLRPMNAAARIPAAAGIPAAAWQTILQSIQADRLHTAKAAFLAPTHLLDPRLEARLEAADQWLETARLLVHDPQANLAFGHSLGVDGDLVVVGAYLDSRLESAGGAAYLFRVPASGWAGIHQIAKLTPSDPDDRDFFGWAVDIHGNDIVVGAPGDDAYKGSAYVFAQPLGGWKDTTEVFKLTASDPDWSDYFGQTVAFAGYATIVVGAPFDDIGVETDQGSVFVFNRSGYIWGNTPVQLTTSEGVAGDYFGGSLAADADTIVVGAHGHHNGAVQGAGQAYVYLHSNGWVERNEDAILLASDAADREYLGWSVAVDGDVIVVGAPGEDSFDSNGQEAAYIYLRPAGDWSGMVTEDAQLTASDGEIDDDFGSRVAIAGEVIAVGAGSEGISGGSALGAVYVYPRPAGGWANSTEADKLVASGDEYDQDFAACLAVQDGVILAGAPKSNIPEYVDHGTVYVFTPQADPPTFSEFLHLPVVLRR